MKKYASFILPPLLAALGGCASFNSGDIKVSRDTARAMLEDKAVVPFAALDVSWQVYPYRAPTDSIGEGSISRPRVIKPVEAEPEDAARLSGEAERIFSDAGLLDKTRGRGTLRLQLTTLGKWTYGDLFRSFLVDTGFIFIIPASLRVNYLLTADFADKSGPQHIETVGRNKTTFHLLMAPLYPFFAPGRRENSLVRQMLWRSATDVYSRLKAGGGVPADLPAAQEKPEPVPLPGPPLQPDRTWLPGQSRDGAPEETITPEAPDKTWVVPGKGQAAPAAAPAAVPAAAQQQPAGQTPPAGPADGTTPDD